MSNYIDLFISQLKDTKDCPHKEQLAKYGLDFLKDMLRNSILEHIANLDLSDVEPVFVCGDLRKVPVSIKIPTDLETFSERVLKVSPNLANISLAKDKTISTINNSVMNFLLKETSTVVSMNLTNVLSKRNSRRVLILGNDILPKDYPMKVSLDNYNLHLLGETVEGDLLYHCSYVDSNTVFSIDILDDKPLNYNIYESLNLYNNQFWHKALISVKNPTGIKRYKITS